MRRLPDDDANRNSDAHGYADPHTEADTVGDFIFLELSMAETTPQESEVDTVYVIDEEMKEQIRQIRDAIWIGNGKPSLMMRVASLEGNMTLLKWVGAAFGILIIGLVWAILTHQVQVVYP